MTLLKRRSSCRCQTVVQVRVVVGERRGKKKPKENKSCWVREMYMYTTNTTLHHRPEYSSPGRKQAHQRTVHNGFARLPSATGFPCFGHNKFCQVTEIVEVCLGGCTQHVYVPYTTGLPPTARIGQMQPHTATNCRREGVMVVEVVEVGSCTGHMTSSTERPSEGDVISD